VAREIDLKKFAQELGVWNRNHLVALRNAAARGVARSIPDLIKASPFDTGLYAQSWDMLVTEESVILGNYAPHAGVIEHGARPFTPPLAPLLAWAKRVTGDPSQPPSYSPRVRALAIYTQKKIAEHGMKPRHILQNAIPGILENIRQEMLKL
jgi:hypothetical protein